MSRRVLTTSRLKLRPLEDRDAADITRLIADWDVIRWLTMPPHPYTRADAEWFIGDKASDGAFGIEFGGDLAGVISLDDGLGYWLGKPFWGQGLMTEAAEALVADHFAHDNATISSAYIPGNTASCNVLTKLGFRNSGIKTAYSKPLGREVALQAMELTSGQWHAERRLRIETDRLLIRPFAPGDLDLFHAIARQPRVSQMLASIPHPLTLDTARDWIGTRQFRGRVPFCAAIAQQGGPLVGLVGIGGDPVSTMYFIDPDHWGKGYATEAMQGFLAHVFDRFGLDAVIAGANENNPASQRVLARLGFAETHREAHQPSARLEPDPVIMYRLTRTHLKART